MRREIDELRRRFFSTVAMTLAAGRLGVFDIAHAQSGTTTQAAVPERHTSFASMKQINAGALNVGYAEAGPANGPAVLLLHAGRTTFTLMLTLPRCWRPGGTE